MRFYQYTCEPPPPNLEPINKPTKSKRTHTGATVQVGIDASKVQITKLKLNKARKEILDRKGRGAVGKGKFSQSEVENMGGVD